MRWLRRLVDPEIPIVDDAGASHTLRNDPGERGDDEAEARQNLHPVSRWQRVVGALIIFGAVCAWLMIIAQLFRLGARVGNRIGVPGQAGGIVGLGAIVASWLLASRVLMLRKENRQIAGKAEAWPRLLEGRCGVCGYRLAQALGGEALTLCPECGAKWRREAWIASVVHAPRPESEWRSAGRGRKFRMRDARDNRVLLLAGRDRTVVRGEVRGVLRGEPPRRASVVFGVTALVIAVAAPLMVYEYVGPLAGTLACVVPALIGWLAIARISRERRDAAMSVVVGELVARGECPQCERPLRKEPAHADGVLLCDCCGAGWRPSPLSEAG